MSDVQLVTALARDDEVALAEICRRHGLAVRDQARRILHDATEADDVAQEVFLHLWHRPDRFDPTRGSLRSFLVTQSHGRAIDFIRSRRARSLREAKTVQRTARTDDDLQREVCDMSLGDQVKRALAALPQEERRVLQLAFFGGRTYREVALLLDQPEGTVKSRIRNGMRRMRVTLIEAGVHGIDAP